MIRGGPRGTCAPLHQGRSNGTVAVVRVNVDGTLPDFVEFRQRMRCRMTRAVDKDLCPYLGMLNANAQQIVSIRRRDLR
jgi:hypothetical protein